MTDSTPPKSRPTYLVHLLMHGWRQTAGHLGPWLAARLVNTARLSWQRLTLALTPLAAASVILGLSMLTVTHLKAEHLWLGWLPAFRIVLLSLGGLASFWLSLALLRTAAISRTRQVLASVAILLPILLMTTIWYLVFFVW